MGYMEANLQRLFIQDAERFRFVCIILDLILVKLNAEKIEFFFLLVLDWTFK